MRFELRLQEDSGALVAEARSDGGAGAVPPLLACKDWP